MKVTNISGLVSKLKALASKAKDAGGVVEVGYTQNYAIYVHEDMNAHHPVGQAKFLEQPARQIRAELAATIRTGYIRTGSMRDALLIAGLRLQRESQLLVPVDTSALKASAYTAFEEDAAQVSAEAYNKSQQVKQAASKGKSK